MSIAARNAMLAGGTPPVPPVTPSVTKFQVGTTSSKYKVGIHTALAIDDTKPTIVDWGDGTTDTIYGVISQLVHTYAARTATYTVEISDNIRSFALSTNNSTWYSNTTHNQSTIKSILTISSHVKTLTSHAFNHCENMGTVYAGDEGELLFSSQGFQFYATAYYNNGKFDFSGRTITTIPEAAFGDTGFTEFAWPKGIQTIAVASLASNGAFYYNGYLESITIPATVTTIGNYAFASCTGLKTITAEGMAAPSVGSRAFGNSTSGNGTYAGRQYYSAGTNRLYVPAGSTGYDTGAWADPLCNSTKCGFTKVEV